MACCARVQGPGLGLPDARQGRRAAAQSRIASSPTTASIERVVVIGNGIAGVTAADHVRRRHPGVRDRPRRRRAPPPLQPHGHLAADLRALGDAGPLPQPRRLVRGARHHDVAEHAGRADRPRRRARSCSAPASACPYDRLILATGSSTLRPADRGLRRRRARSSCARPRTRSHIRAFAQRHARRARGRRRRRPARARGGLRAAQARPAHDRARALRPPAAPPARRSARPSSCAATSRASGWRS